MAGRYEYSLPSRRERDGWFKLGQVDMTTTAILVALGVLSMFVYAVDKATLVHVVFYGDLVRGGEVWRLATWPVVNPPDRIWVILTLAFFWFVGHAIEDQVGRVRYTWLVVVMTVGSAGLTTLFGMEPTFPTYGLSILGLGMLVIFALDNPGAMFFFGIPAWVLAAIYVAIDVLQYTGDRAFEPLVVELLVIAIGLVGARQFGHLENLAFIPRFLGDGRTTPQRRPRAKGRKGQGSVVAGPWGNEPSRAEADLAALDQLEMDMLLDKISAEGIDSLTKDEKKRLNDLSKRLRGR